MTNPPIMLLGGQDSLAVGIARSLARSGTPVFVGGKGRWPQANYSRYTAKAFRYSADPEEAKHQILETIEKWQPAVLLPLMGSWSLIEADPAAYASRTSIVPHPESALSQRLNNKRSLIDSARECGFPVPETFSWPSVGEALARRHELPYPVLLKPARGAGGKGITLVRNAEALEHALMALKKSVPLIQEYVEGDDLELTILADHGEPIAGSAYIMLRNRPPYGSPCACRTIRDDALMEMGTRYLQRLRYHGVAHLDLRRDLRDGQPKLLDFNTRLAGSNEISLQTGVDFASMLYQMALDRPVASCFDYEVDIEFRWPLFGELQHLVRTPKKRAALSSLLRWKGVRTNLMLSDPMPHIVRSLGAVVGAVRRP